MKKLLVVFAIFLSIGVSAQVQEDSWTIACYGGWTTATGYAMNITNKLTVAMYYEITYPDGYTAVSCLVPAGGSGKFTHIGAFQPGTFTIRYIQPRTNVLSIFVNSTFPKRRC
jgi:hypothetical protein